MAKDFSEWIGVRKAVLIEGTDVRHGTEMVGKLEQGQIDLSDGPRPKQVAGGASAIVPALDLRAESSRRDHDGFHIHIGQIDLSSCRRVDNRAAVAVDLELIGIALDLQGVTGRRTVGVNVQGHDRRNAGRVEASR